MSTYHEEKFGLPKRPKDERTSTCGICESEKQELLGDEGILQCPHCDKACPVPPDESCEICRAGMKGLPDPDLREWRNAKDEEN